MVHFTKSYNRISFKAIFIVIGFFASTETLFGQLTLSECQQRAQNNYPLIKQYDLIDQSKEYTIANANKSFLPHLKLNIIGGVIDGLPTFSSGSESGSAELHLISTIQFNQVIWDGGITKANKEIVESNTQIERADLDASLYEIEDRVNHLFFGILLLEEQNIQLVILKENLARNLKRVEIAVENGTAFRSDIDEIQVEVLNTDQRVSELEFNRSAYLIVLSALIGEEIAPGEQLIRPELETDFASLPLNRPELKIFANREYLYQAQLKRQKASLYPKLGLTAMGAFITPGVGFGISELERVLVGGLSVSWDIGGLYRNGNNKALTDINLQKVNTQKETFVFNTNLKLIRIQEEIRKYRTLINRDEQILGLKSRITKSYQVKYDNGVSTMSELLDKTNEENLATQHLITHELQYLMAIHNYKNISGN